MDMIHFYIQYLDLILFLIVLHQILQNKLQYPHKIREFIPKDLESIQTAILYHHNSYYVGHLLKSSRKYGFYKNAATASMLRMKWSDVLAILKTDFDSNILIPNEIIQGFLAF